MMTIIIIIIYGTRSTHCFSNQYFAPGLPLVIYLHLTHQTVRPPGMEFREIVSWFTMNRRKIPVLICFVSVWILAFSLEAILPDDWHPCMVPICVCARLCVRACAEERKSVTRGHSEGDGGRQGCTRRPSLTLRDVYLRRSANWGLFSLIPTVCHCTSNNVPFISNREASTRVSYCGRTCVCV
jgi:hypothetical protein